MRCLLLSLISAVAAIPSSQWKRQQADNLTWYNDYHPYEDHITYFQSLQAAIPNNSEWVSTGTSYEGRDLYGIHLWGADGPGKQAVLFHATVHAREWIATPVRLFCLTRLFDAILVRSSPKVLYPEVAMYLGGLRGCTVLTYVEEYYMLSKSSQVVEYITQQLIIGYNAGDNTTQSFVNAYDFYIFPIVNPDGELH